MKSATKQSNLGISIAPVPYFWSKECYYEFYEKISQSSASIVYLGETICSKRRTMKLENWIEIANKLDNKGKQVVLSTMNLVEAESELSVLKKISAQKKFLIEANDVSAIQVATQHKRNFVIGNSINLYNNASLAIYKNLGMSRWCVPVELGRQDLMPMMEKINSLDIQLEYQIFGRLPLAYSARCFTARHHQLKKDQCEFRCAEDEQGILMKTQEGDCFAQINGIQIQSGKVSNLFNEWKIMREFGIDIFRIVPVSAEDTLNVIEQLSNTINNVQNNCLDSSELACEYEFCNGYWFQQEGMKLVS